MGRPKKENRRDKKVDVRFTQEEYMNVEKEMYALDYLSMSKYIRDTLLKKNKYKTRGVVKDRELLSRIDNLTNRIKEIGRNYNQLVASYNRLHKSRALTIPIVDEHLYGLESLTQKVFDYQHEIIAEIKNLFSELKDGEGTNKEQ